MKQTTNALINKENIYSHLPKKQKDDSFPNCPHKEIIDLYHEILLELPRVKIWNKFRETLLRTRWKEDKERQTLDWWAAYFRYVKRSDFLMGKATYFRADLEWLIRPKNFPKVLEGRYHDKEREKSWDEF